MELDGPEKANTESGGGGLHPHRRAGGLQGHRRGDGRQRFSSATIRNELADLVELGYLEQPHTSAGRVPSPKGYRLYVNELMERQRLSIAETEKINQSLQMKMEELDRVISQAGRAVSSFVNYPAYVAAAGKGSVTASRFELLPVDEKSCIVVMMMGDNRVKSQLLRMQLKVEPGSDGRSGGAAEPALHRHLHKGDEPEADGRFTGHHPPAVSAAEPDGDLRRGCAGGIRTTGSSSRRAANQLLKLPEFRDADKAHELMSFLADEQGEACRCRTRGP